MRQDQLAGKSTHSLTNKSVPELNDQPTYITANVTITHHTHYRKSCSFRFVENGDGQHGAFK